ncbi:MAG: hypothetical protein GEU28_08940 [Dehalococcoidia bacterium]|nr:hypothetical protein [Dehalococcoidia bacterium]
MSTKLEQEIEEILARTGELPKPTRLRRPSRLKSLLGGLKGGGLPAFIASINPGQLMLASALIVVGSWFILRPLPDLMMLVAIAGLILFVFAFGLSIVRRRGGGVRAGSSARYWRGQPLDYGRGSATGLRNPLRRIFGRRR